MNKKLLVDFITFDVDKSVLTEAMAKGGPFTVQGVLQRAEWDELEGYLRMVLQKRDDAFRGGKVRGREGITLPRILCCA